MKEEFQAIVERYGQSVTCYGADGEATGRGRAFLRPVAEKKWQVSAWALGSAETDRFLCLAPAGLPLGRPGDGDWLECGSVRYQVMAVHGIPLGDGVSHQWAVLERRAEDAV